MYIVSSSLSDYDVAGLVGVLVGVEGEVVW